MPLCLVWLALSCVVWAQPRLDEPETAARLLAREAVVAELGGDAVQLERVQSATILRSRAMPWADIAVIRPRQAPQVSARGSWEVPPFPQIAAPGDVAAETSQIQEPEVAAPAFDAVDVGNPRGEVRVRPRPGPRRVHVVLDDTQIPEPLSRVCYTSGSLGVCQFSLYGGGSSYFAEQAFVALRNALDSKEGVEGFGEAAVLGVYDEARVQSRDADKAFFQDIPVEGKARPEAVDPGLLKASSAPTFQGVSTELTPHTALDLSRLPRPHPRPEQAPRRYWILLAYFPGKALTLELALDQRLGTPQQAVDLARVVQTRMNER